MSGGTLSAATPVQPQLRPGLGRQYSPDPRDRAFTLTPKLMATLAKVAPVKPRTQPWHLGPEILDQGNTSECVVHAYLHFMQAAPQVHSLGWARSARSERYDLARQRDGFPMPHDGTTARAVLDIARQQGEIAEYVWTPDEDIARQQLRERGGLMAGCDWFPTMFSVDKHGYMEPSGSPVGGHETFVRWYYDKKHRTYADSYELENSWWENGKPWGWQQRGIFRLKADVFNYLIFQLNGDLVSGLETAVVRLKKMEKAA